MLRLCELAWRGCSGKRKPRELTWRVQREKEAENREYDAKLDRLRRERSLGTHPSAGKAVVVQLTVGELPLRLWVPCGHVG